MKRIIVLAAGVFMAAFVASAQNVKFGHINMQEVIYLMDETDSARVEMEKFSMDMQATFNAMKEEFDTKYRTYQQMGANWTPSVLAAKEQELSDLQNRLVQYEQNANIDMNNLQQQLMAPIVQKANAAVEKIGKLKGLIYVFDISSGAVIYADTAQSMDLTVDVKTELGIPLDKTLPQAQPQM
ncbi:MAG TPA: OmpH family outer membrane protein [Candidatus Coprenecus pullistercoris]|nr:OmpH family outer membrane protein [Candidatus Coprenecus pullistercoris]